MKKTLKGYQKGVNLGGWLSQCRHEKMHYDTFITEEDIEKIAGFGVDHIRLPLDYELLETPRGMLKEEGFVYIDRCIAWCRKRNLNMILDLHKTAGYSFHDPLSSKVFFTSETLQSRFIKLWEILAKRYGKYEDMIAFELLNEIVHLESAPAWNHIAARAVQCIRRYAPNISILIGGVFYNSIYGLEYLDSPYDKNIVYNFHCYEPILFTHQSASWTAQMPRDMVMKYPASYEEYEKKTRILEPMSNKIFDAHITDTMGQSFFEAFFSAAVKIAEERNAALYCGEYGVIDKAPVKSTLNWYRDIHGAFEKFGIGRAVWSYKEMNFGITGAHYQGIFDELITLL